MKAGWMCLFLGFDCHVILDCDADAFGHDALAWLETADDYIVLAVVFLLSLYGA